MKNQNSKINEFIKKNSGLSYDELSDRIRQELGLDVSSESVRKRYSRLGLPPKKVNSQNRDLLDLPEPKSGLEIRGEHIVINWSNQTIITELGEWGQMVCSFDMHNAIQRSYVTAGENETAAIVAMKFDFPHAKAVNLYAKHHGFTKSSLPQTDLEFEMGLTPEEAVQRNIQTMKRETYKKTERAKWKVTQDAANRWFDFHHNVLKPFENHIEEYLPKMKLQKLNLPKLEKEKVASVIGSSDLHFMKQCYDAYGKEIYNQEIALQKIADHTARLIAKKLQSGVPEKFYLTIGGDDLHIDNPMQTTTKGTPQSNSTQGSYRIALGPYLDMTIATIECFAQVAPVEVILTPGNHNENTAYLLGTALEQYYALRNKMKGNHKVNMTVRFHERVYMQYGSNCFIFNHMSKMSLTKTKRDLHKLILSEARSQGIDLQTVKNFTMFGQHLHHDLQEDLGGMVELIVFMSLSEEDDWHQDSGYVGSKKRLAMYNYHKDNGKDSVIYS